VYCAANSPAPSAVVDAMGAPHSAIEKEPSNTPWQMLTPLDGFNPLPVTATTSPSTRFASGVTASDGGGAG